MPMNYWKNLYIGDSVVVISWQSTKLIHLSSDLSLCIFNLNFPVALRVIQIPMKKNLNFAELALLLESLSFQQNQICPPLSYIRNVWTTNNILICSDGDALFEVIPKKKRCHGRHAMDIMGEFEYWTILWVDMVFMNGMEWMNLLQHKDIFFLLDNCYCLWLSLQQNKALAKLQVFGVCIWLFIQYVIIIG